MNDLNIEIVEFSTKGPKPRPPLPQWNNFLLSKNDLHIVKRILYGTGRKQLPDGLTKELKIFRWLVMVK